MNVTETPYPAAPAVDTSRIRELLGYLVAGQGDIGPAAAAELSDLTRELLARPVPDITVNAGFTVRAVMPDGNPMHSPGSWWVACEDPDRGAWVTWHCAAGTGDFAGTLGFAWGNYFHGDNARRRALTDLAVRAGTMPQMARLIAAEMTNHHPEHGPWTLTEKRQRRTAGHLHQWAGK